MRAKIVIPLDIEQRILAHFFQNKLEQAAFLFSRTQVGPEVITVQATSAYLIPPEGWDVQEEIYLEMQDAERAKIMKMARDLDCGVIDCHSHPGSQDQVCFSLSDRAGITQFAAYAKWKLPGQPYAALVWGETSLDAVLWQADFRAPEPLDEVVVLDGSVSRVVRPRFSWFSKPSISMRLRSGARAQGK